MAQELTTEYNMENWLEATKNWESTTYSIERYGEIPSTIYIRDIPFPKEDTHYERSDFERDLGRVSRRRTLPIGEHIREAIDIIKRKDE